MPDIMDSTAVKYAEWCLQPDNDKVGHYVKLQAQDWLRIARGDDDRAYVDEKAYEKICGLLKLMVHPDLHCSLYDGIESYAWLFITAALCTMWRDGQPIYDANKVSYSDLKIRYYETALLEISRKNHKSFYTAVVIILLMLTEKHFSRFFSVAPILDQSSEVKLAARKILKSSPLLMDEADPAFKIMVKDVRCLLTDSTFTPLAYSKDNLDSRLANAFIADEAGGMDSYPLEAMRSSQIEIPNKLGMVISTQYPNDNNVFIDEVDISKKILDRMDGLLDSIGTYFSLLYEPNDDLKQGDIWMHDDRVIYQSNPIAVDKPAVFANLVKKRTAAILYENKRENFLCKHCNILYKGLGAEGYIDIQKVKACRRENDPSWWRGRRVWLGLDLSQTSDNTAVAMVTDDNGTIFGNVMAFLPEAAVDLKSAKEKVDYRRCAKAGECIPCGDEVIDYSVVEQYIMTLEKRLGVEVVQVGYDRYNAISTVQKLEAEGITCVEIKQHSSVLHAPTKLLQEKVLCGQFRYDASRLLEINFQNARCTLDTNLNRYVNKKKSSGKVDEVVALINAIYLLQQDILYNDGFVAQVL
jgi:phage terminase large subunit-like protein